MMHEEKNEFLKNWIKLQEEIRTSWKIHPVKLPSIDYITDGDEFYEQLWGMIDKAKTYVWITTYIMDSKASANITFQKLIEAQKRGVHVILCVDDLGNALDKRWRDKLKASGALYYTLNPFIYTWRFLAKRRLFSRHHEKIVISDDSAIIGSSNIAEEYGGFKHGSYDFWDLNLVLKNHCLKSLRHYYAFVLRHNDNRKGHPTKSMDQVLAEYDEMYPDSPYKIPNTRIIRCNNPHLHEIQDEIFKMLDSAKEKITIIQPYYNRIKKVEQALIEAAQRGVHVELITAGKRDQICYSNLKNGMLMRALIKAGIKVYEHPDRYLHMKTYMVDDHLFTVGSFNNDKWSWNVNNEVNILIDDKDEFAKMSAAISELKRSCRLVEPDPVVGITRRVKQIFWGTFLFISEWFSNQRRVEKTLKKDQLWKQLFWNEDNFRRDYNLKYKYHNIYNDWDDSYGREL